MLAIYFKKAFEAAKLSIVLAIILGTLVELIDYFVPSLDSLSTFSVPIIYFVIFAYAGYNATKKLKQGLITAGLAGAIAAAITYIALIIILDIIFLAIRFPPAVEDFEWWRAEFGDKHMEAFILSSFVLFVFRVVGDFVVGLIGGFIGQRYK